MKKKVRYECIDAGSEYCPCYLAETNDCITCSYLQGKEFCDCEWKGVCVYQEFIWNKERGKGTRSTIEGTILSKKKIGDNLIILNILVGRTLARQLKQPGSYVFIRQINKPQYFDVPMSIMDSNDYSGEIQIAIQIIGSKTKSLLDLKDKILIRGPYWNGLLGLKDLKRQNKSNTLIVARGAGLSPAVLIAKYLIRNNNRVTFIMDKGKISEYFINSYINDLNIVSIEADVISQKGKLLLEELIRNNNYNLCYSGGSSTQHEELNSLLRRLSPETKFVMSNNKEICCGEGICGSCSIKIGDEVIKTCKTQIGASYLINKGED